MKIALNAQLLSRAPSYRSAGINRVIYELLAHLTTVPSRSRYVVYAPESAENRELLASPNVEPRLTRLPTYRPAMRIGWEQTLLPVELRRRRVDLLHSLAFVSPFLWRGPTVVTVYDLSFLRFPEVFNRANRVYLSTMTPPSLRRADRVITISEFVRQEVIRLCGVDPDRVTAIPLAADARFRPAEPEAVARFRRERELPARFILYMGTLQPRKNIETLVRAYAQLRQDGHLEQALVLAGGRGWQYESIFALVRQLGLESQVHFPGFVPDEEQALWYTAADIFAFPSLYEGFGLPPLEAMACGTPVVASTSSSLPEVVGDAGVLVEPTDVGGLATTLRHLLDDEGRRVRMRKAGLVRAASFSWRRMAEETVQVYDEVLRRR
jgi:glycosyltransferase involved in cell wall biosynthesis